MKTNTLPGSLSWATCFDKFLALPQATRFIIRRAAADSLAGSGEIGSSDVNHAIFAIYRRNEGDFARVIAELFAEVGVATDVENLRATFI